MMTKAAACVLGLVLTITPAFSSRAATRQAAPECTTAEQCRQLTREAMTSGQYERAHDLAWLAFQKSPKQDPATMALLARAQSLSGRSDDAYVMLRRLAEAGVRVEDVESDDFRRVRSHPQWPALLAMFEALDRPAPEPVAVDLPAPVAPSVPPPASAPPARATEDLAVPETVAMPVAIAHDAVSARFVLGTSATDALTVLSQTSTNAAAFTSPGWSGMASTTAIAIDRSAGDLWVAGRHASGGILHRLQLISGRRLEAIALPEDAGDAELIALAVTREGVLALDRAGRRVFKRAPRAKTLEVHIALPQDLTPTALTHSPNALYVAHTKGISRIDGSQRRRPVSFSNAGAIANLHSLAWHDGVLIGLQQSGDRWSVVRARLNTTGTAITRVDVLDRAASPAATLSGAVYYYAAEADVPGRLMLRAIVAK